jgi:hypothetical protein
LGPRQREDKSAHTWAKQNQGQRRSRSELGAWVALARCAGARELEMKLAGWAVGQSNRRCTVVVGQAR